MIHINGLNEATRILQDDSFHAEINKIQDFDEAVSAICWKLNRHFQSMRRHSFSELYRYHVGMPDEAFYEKIQVLVCFPYEDDDGENVPVRSSNVLIVSPDVVLVLLFIPNGETKRPFMYPISMSWCRSDHTFDRFIVTLDVIDSHKEPLSDRERSDFQSKQFAEEALRTNGRTSTAFTERHYFDHKGSASPKWANALTEAIDATSDAYITFISAESIITVVAQNNDFVAIFAVTNDAITFLENTSVPTALRLNGYKNLNYDEKVKIILLFLQDLKDKHILYL
jgi:hypothetical protein